MIASAHNAPAINRRKISTEMLVAKPDTNEKLKPHSAATHNTFCLPQQSTRNPQRYDVDTIPRNDTDVSTPCSDSDNFKSHFAYGKI